MPKTSPKTSTWRRLARKASPSAGPPGWGGGGWSGGPVWSDAYRTRRAPSPPELVECYKGVVAACSGLNQSGVARTRLGLYATTGDGQARPKCAHRTLRPEAKAMLAASGGGLPQTAIYFQKMASAADVAEVAEHTLLEMVRDVNDDWDYDALVRFAVACLDVVGWFFLWPEPTLKVRDKPAGHLLWPLLSQYIFPERTPEGSLVQKYDYFGKTFEPGDLVRGRCLSLRDPYGLGYGPTQASYAYVGLSDQYASLQENLLTQGGRISGFVTDADPMAPAGKPEMEKFVRNINATYTRGGAGTIPYVPGAVKLVPTAWPPTDLAAMEVDERAAKRIANCFGVPLSLLHQEDMSLASAEAGHRQHAEMAIDPRCTLIAGALTKWTRRHGREHQLPGWDRLYWAFDNPVAEDEEKQAKIIDMGLKSGRFTINQVNQDHGLDAVPWGDEPWLPSTWVQPSTAAEMRDQASQLAERQQAAAEEPKPEGEGEPGAEGEGDNAKALEGEDRHPFRAVGWAADHGDEGQPGPRGRGRRRAGA